MHHFQMQSSAALGTFSLLCNCGCVTIHPKNSGCLAKLKLCTGQKRYSLFPLPQPPATTTVLSVSMKLTPLGASYK